MVHIFHYKIYSLKCVGQIIIFIYLGIGHAAVIKLIQHCQ